MERWGQSPRPQIAENRPCALRGDGFPNMEEMKLSVFLAAASAAAAAVAGAASAGAAMGTADALLTALFGLSDVKRCTADDGGDHQDQNNVNRSHRLTSFRTGHTPP